MNLYAITPSEHVLDLRDCWIDDRAFANQQCCLHNPLVLEKKINCASATDALVSTIPVIFMLSVILASIIIPVVRGFCWVREGVFKRGD